MLLVLFPPAVAADCNAAGVDSAACRLARGGPSTHCSSSIIARQARMILVPLLECAVTVMYQVITVHSQLLFLLLDRLLQHIS